MLPLSFLSYLLLLVHNVEGRNLCLNSIILDSMDCALECSKVVSQLRLLPEVCNRSHFTAAIEHFQAQQLSLPQYFTQDMAFAVFWDACSLSYLAHLQSPVCQYEIVDLCYDILVVTVFGAYRRGSLKIDVQSHWNSLSEFLRIVIKL